MKTLLTLTATVVLCTGAPGATRVDRAPVPGKGRNPAAVARVAAAVS